MKSSRTFAGEGPQLAEKKTSQRVLMLLCSLTWRRPHLCTRGFHGLRRTCLPPAVEAPALVTSAL